MTSVTSGGSLSSLLNALTGSSSSSGTPSSSTGTGQAILSSAGIGSGLDVTSIVTALVNAKQAAPQAQITNAVNAANSTLTGLGTLSSTLNSLQSAVTALTNASTYDSYTASLAATTIGTVSTLSNASPGSYALNVTQLATAQQRTSSAYAGTAAIGSGTLNIAVGSSNVSIAVSSTATLSDIATAINGASGNPGVIATVINGTGGSQLLLSSGKTGVVNGFTISAAGGSSSGLASLATGLNTAGSSEAKDAQLTLNGIGVSSASNAVSGAIDGVTLNLAATGSTTLSVTQDTSSTVTAIQAFVTAYNSYASSIGTLSSYNATTHASGPLLGDSTLNSVQSQISGALSKSVPGNSIGSLASLGITRQADGTLSVNSTTLNAALSANPAAVKDLFSGTNGYATHLDTVIGTFTSSTGIIPTRQQSITSSLSTLSTQQTALNARMAVYQQQLQAQYTNLDTLMSSLNNTSSFLTTTLAQLNNTSKN
ncbi:flagellar filament capping protein FliD [Rhodanobacter terrae]|uniref:Flagellar hook-associated protein 2 n=1 Tax=Rhodanobacter terrae TaxID=418647 RepID=A0ABW0SUS9_9GAMM